ncbi:metallophosphoesterase family protein [Tautonia plasticadhaerens]|uniref:Phosphodiesterase n=1 Tax=Tautonia plasticadhaerens TaxID=2527974 RepID=A0A518GY81_9BACT|nr:metallophosphoesterase family protein [Tautonia plasticadhaerens]QDV33556.1 phosphodiesterase [Tautonia plasticadhaerens]
MSLLGLISDVHGDPIGLELAWAHLTVMGAGAIVCAGDLVGYGPSPDRAVAFLEGRQIPSVRGNHDRWALERGPGEPDEFGGGTPGEETLEALKRLESSLVLERGGMIVVVVHGSPRGDMEFIAPRTHPPYVLDSYLDTLGADAIVHGHTHRPMWYRSSRDRLVVNPGSIISAPVVATSRTFATLDTATRDVRFFDVESGNPVEVPAWPGSG